MFVNPSLEVLVVFLDLFERFWHECIHYELNNSAVNVDLYVCSYVAELRKIFFEKKICMFFRKNYIFSQKKNFYSKTVYFK